MRWFNVDLEFDEFEPLFLADFWPGSSLVGRISPKLQTDVLNISEWMNEYKSMGVAGTWRYHRAFFP